jgi:hypothetical protein
LISLSAYWVLAMTATVGPWPSAEIWAGASFLLTCGLLGLAALSAVFSGGKDRERWLGAALFGFGYLALTLSPDPSSTISRRTITPGRSSAWSRKQCGV